MKNNTKKTVLNSISFLSALLVATIAVSVMIVWQLKNPDLVARYDWIFYMQYTTAMLFLASSAGLCLSLLQYRKTAAALGVLVAGFAALILFEYVAGISLGIDQIFLKDYVHENIAYPGRPAPNTATAFLFFGAALVFTVNHTRPAFRNAFIDFTGFFIFALGAHALGGHLQSVEQAYAWGSQTRMSLHTALSNMTLGMGLLSLSWSAQKADKAKIPFWVPAVMCFLALQADLIVPVDVNASIIYIPLLFCSLWFPAPGMVFIFAAITTFFTTWRFLILPPEYMTQELVTNRFITIATIWFISVLIYWKRTTDIVSQRNKKYLQAVLDNTVDGIVVIDDEGRIKDFNTACEKLFGYETPEIMGKNVNVLMPAPYHDEHDQYLSHYLATGQKKIIGIGRQVEGRHKDGTIFPIDLSVSELTINGTQFFTGIIRDIREIEELKKTEEELLRSNTELERFAFVAAHDLQEPLRIITKSSEFIQEDYGKTLDQEGLRYLGNIQASARHMRGLISDLLDYSRLGSEENAYDEISVYDAIQTALANLTEDIKTRKTTITIDEDNLPLVAANPVQLVRLYQNLIGNALKYSDKEERIIHMGVQDEGEKWLFFVKDNGIGIDPQYQDQIFVPFKRLHTRKDYPGTGIGLAMCKRIVENHDGRIWCDSTLGNGTTFYFSLPKSEA